MAEDVIRIVLSRLPAKSLLRFKTVSKSWCTMISDPTFIQVHLQQSKCSNSPNLFLWNYSPNYALEEFILVKLEGRKFLADALLERPYSLNLYVSCFGDGMVLLSNYSCSTYVLWNPSSRIWTMFWFPYRFNDSPMSYGVCYDPTTNDFKVVIISWKCYTVFSCKNRSWTERKEFSYASGTLSSDPGLSVDGAIYWVWTDIHKSHSNEIIYFDPRDDEFKILQKPKHVDGSSDKFFLICLTDCLCLCCCREDAAVIEIWIKEKGRDRISWKEFMTIEINVEMPPGVFKPLCFVGNKIVICVGLSRQVIYSPSEKTFEEVEGSEVFGQLRSAVPWVETLFTPIQNTRPKRKRNAYLTNYSF